MARKIANYTAMAEGRDQGKVFLLTEMSASQAEAWAARAILALMRNGVELPEGFENLGMAGMAEIGIKALAGLRWEDAEPLLAEMWTCIQFIPNPVKPQLVRPLMEDDVEEVQTRLALRMELWKLHVDFSKAAAPSISGAHPAARRKS